MEFEDLPAPTHIVRIRYPAPSQHHAEYFEHTIDLTYSIDPTTQIGVARFSLEAMQDIVAVGIAKGMNIEMITIADLPTN